MVCQGGGWWCYHYNWENCDPGEPHQDHLEERQDTLQTLWFQVSLSGSWGRAEEWGTSSLDPTVILGVKQSMLALLSTLCTRGNKMKCLIMAQRVCNSLYSLTNATFSWDSFWDCWGPLDDFLICGRAALLWFFSPWGFNNLNPLVKMVWSFSPVL